MFIRSLVTAAMVSMAVAHCVREYTVKEGDYCDKISAAEGVSTYQLASVNNGIINDDCTNLIPGQKICLGYEGEDCRTVYVVAGGDTCEDIATTHKTNLTLLHQKNPQIDVECTNIYVGEVLCINLDVAVPPPVVTSSSTVPSATIPPVPEKTPKSTDEPSKPDHKPPKSTDKPPKQDDEPCEDEGDDDNDDEDLPWCDEI